MKVEQSKAKIIISNKEYEALIVAHKVILEIKELLSDNDLDILGFYDELVSLEDSLDTFKQSFEKTKYDEYFMEVN